MHQIDITTMFWSTLTLASPLYEILYITINFLLPAKGWMNGEKSSENQAKAVQKKSYADLHIFLSMIIFQNPPL